MAINLTVTELREEVEATAAYATEISRLHLWLEGQLRPVLERERRIKADIHASWRDPNGVRERKALFRQLDRIAALYGRRRQALHALAREVTAAGHAHRAACKLLADAEKKNGQKATPALGLDNRGGDNVDGERDL